MRNKKLLILIVLIGCLKSSFGQKNFNNLGVHFSYAPSHEVLWVESDNGTLPYFNHHTTSEMSLGVSYNLFLSKRHGIRTGLGVRQFGRSFASRLMDTPEIGNPPIEWRIYNIRLSAEYKFIMTQEKSANTFIIAGFGVQTPFHENQYDYYGDKMTESSIDKYNSISSTCNIGFGVQLFTNKSISVELNNFFEYYLSPKYKEPVVSKENYNLGLLLMVAYNFKK